jgi:SAM-dependent methyltransferase
MSDAATLAFYEREAPDYTASGAQGCGRHLDAFLDRLSSGARILELGCGGGRDAARMIERGFAVDATDGTAAMVDKARERFGVEARQMRFDELDAEAEYDAVWAHASLLHATREALPAVLARIRRALANGGWHYANYKLGNGEARDTLGRLFNFPNAEWLLATYREAGLEVVETDRYRGSGADNITRDWLGLTVRRYRFARSAPPCLTGSASGRGRRRGAGPAVR